MYTWVVKSFQFDVLFLDKRFLYFLKRFFRKYFDFYVFIWHTGFIKAIQLDYNAAHDHLVSANRKAPQQTAIGFKQALHKLNTVVELLLGELPDRSIFRQQELKDALHPYFQLTQAIHAGDLGQFGHVLKTYAQQFNHDKTYTLILRLRHNVIKTGVRRISLSYSKISLIDVAEKLQLDSSEDAEYIVAKVGYLLFSSLNFTF